MSRHEILKSIKITRLRVGFLAGILAIAGCATIVKGSHQAISVDSNVQGAQVFFNGQIIGVTPLTALVGKANSATITVTKDGYQAQTLTANTTITGAFFGNIFTAGPIGSTTDIATGSAYEYSPSNYFVTLVPEGASKLQLQRLRKEADLRKYILYNYSDLIHDASSGDGEFLDALADMVSLNSKSQKSVLASKLVTLHQDSWSSPDFAKRVLVLARKGSLVG